jgi:two-component system chemotaxis response regulator CheB
MGIVPAGRRVRAMLVDDSAVVRKVLAEVLQAGGVDVVGTASDPLFAWERMQADWPDVIVLDVEMPRMDGISFLRKIMHERPTPVVMCSSLTQRGAETTLQAMAAGAVGVIAKPTMGLKGFLEESGEGIAATVKAAARANVGALARGREPGGRGAPCNGTGAAATGGLGARSAAGADALSADAARRPKPDFASPGAMAQTSDRLIAIGLSTGGVQAIETVLRRLPRTIPGIVIVQHMPERFTASLAARLDALCEVSVAEARSGDRVLDGRVLIAPGGRHMRLVRSGAQYVVEIVDGPAINHHKPSVDVLFRSVAHCAGRNAIGVIMTGMGDDGARGLREMHAAGALTAAQDEASCVVFGMPREAIRLGAADEVLPLEGIAGWLQAVAAGQAA